MTIGTHYLAAVAVIAAFAVPASAQTGYPYATQQAYPQYQRPYTPQQPYPVPPAYGYSQGYTAQNPIGQIIDQLLGSSYNVIDRQAVSRCASAATNEAESQYGGRYSQGYGSPGYNRGYNNGLRVTAITDIKRRNNGLRVSGLMSSGYGGYDHEHGYQNGGYAAGDVTFRCNVAYNGAVTDIRIGYNQAYRR